MEPCTSSRTARLMPPKSTTETQSLHTYVEGMGMVLHLKVRRRDGKDGISWDDLQKIKNEYAGEDKVAIEIYPRESDVVNETNMRHLWVIPPSFPIPNLRR